jgi:hypothetical protein
VHNVYGGSKPIQEDGGVAGAVRDMDLAVKEAKDGGNNHT